MSKHLLFLLFITVSIVSIAAPVSSKSAQEVASRYLLNAIGEKSSSILTLKHTYTGQNGQPTLYIFDIDTRGFILISADDAVEPVLGYSFNGVFDTTRLAPSFRNWINDYCLDIEAIASSKRQLHAADADLAIAEWTALRTNDRSFYAAKPGSVEPLLTSTWEQGEGYNSLCPVYANGSGGHSYVGCVATAMAQIIRYHGYPTTGFGTSTYVHPNYGRQTANHDSVVYDFSLMPDKLNYYSSNSQRYAVALLCYHCGVSVKMNYQNPSHTSGSGAQTSDAVEALRHFGYFHCKHAMKTDMTDQEWKMLVRNELDHGRPILYSGRESTEEGHAFVCDGYRTSNNKFHFNWGWGGWQDGFYTMTDMNGFTGGQQGVYNIYPSGLAANLDTTYVTVDGSGDGSSWQHPTAQLNDALQARSYYKSGHIWVKEGTYYGSEDDPSVIQLANGVRLYGGFAGYETGIAQRTPKEHPTILDGQNRQAIVTTPNITKTTYFKDFILQNGIGSKIAALKVSSNVQATDLTIRRCNATGTGDVIIVSGGLMQNCLIENCSAHSDSGAILNLDDGTCRSIILRNNKAHMAALMSDGLMQNSLITHNQGIGVRINSSQAKLQCCDITYNDGIGLSLIKAKEVRNCLIYQNASDTDTSLFSGVSYCAFSDNGITGTGNITLSDDDIVFWMDMMPRGPHPNDDFSSYSWHLKVGSPCIDAGDSITVGIPTTDLDGHKRVVGDRIDIGCCEHRSVGIESPAKTSIRIWPNPVHDCLYIAGPDDATYTLYSIQGVRLCEWNHQPAATTLSLTGLRPGLYLLQTQGCIQKVVVK